jgi:hypothetical protein
MVHATVAVRAAWRKAAARIPRIAWTIGEKQVESLRLMNG